MTQPTQPSGLIIGPGFQQWITDHQATPLSDEQYFSAEFSCMLTRVSSNGADTTMLLLYNKMTNEIVPFVQATL